MLKNILFAPMIEYHFGNGGMEEKSLYYYHSDHLGSTSYVTDRDGRVSQFVAYLPFGESLYEQHSNTKDMPYLFNGKERDEETGLYYYGARYYDPWSAVWSGVDPMWVKYPNISPFVYCDNNPVIYVDPTGEAPTGWVRTESGAYVYDSRVQTQKDALKYYGENAQAIATGYYYKAEGGTVTLGENGKYTYQGKTHEVENQATGLGKAWAAFKNFDAAITDGGNDPANTGVITKDDVTVGLAIVGAMSGVGILAEGTGLLVGAITTAGILNNVDDMFTKEGKSLSQQMVKSESVSDVIGGGKTLVSVANIATNVSSPSKLIKSPAKVVNTATDVVSVGSSLNKTFKRLQPKTLD